MHVAKSAARKPKTVISTETQAGHYAPPAGRGALRHIDGAAREFVGEEIVVRDHVVVVRHAAERYVGENSVAMDPTGFFKARYSPRDRA